MNKLFNRLKGCLMATAGNQKAVEPTFAPSRTEQNLAWLPHNGVLEPLDLPPPDCPLLGLVGVPLQQRYSAFMAQVAKTPAPVADATLGEAGRHLASDLLSQAITLGSNKAHETSDEIYWLVQSAATVSMFTDGAQSVEFARYHPHVRYYEAAPRMAAQVQAFDRYVAACGLPVADSEIQSRSADGGYRVMVRPWEAANSHWVYSPRIVDTRQGTCLLHFEDARWSAQISTWRTPSTVELVLRKYPGNQPRSELRVIIDCANRCARLEEGGEVELTKLEGELDARLDNG